MKLTELLQSHPDPLWRLVKQCGVDDAVVLLDGAEQESRWLRATGAPPPSSTDEHPWGEAAIKAQQERLADHGLTMAAIEDTPPLDAVRLGTAHRDEQISHTIEQIRARATWRCRRQWSRAASPRTNSGTGWPTSSTRWCPLDLHPSPANAVTLCQGNFALMTDDLPAVIRELGARDAIAFVHFRDVKGTPDDFVETFHDDGQTDLAACVEAYAEVGFDGPLRPDHVPTLEGEDNARPGYATMGRLFALGYIRALRQVHYGR